MEQKIKFILVGLVGVAAVFIFLFLQTLNSKQLIMKERDSLTQENASLNSRAQKLNRDLGDAQNKMDSLRIELGNISSERDELQKKYEIADKAKQELIDKLQLRQPQTGAAELEPTTQQRSEKYWAGILKQKTELQMQLDGVRNELKMAQTKNEELQRDKGALELDISDLKRQAEELQHQVAYNKKVMDNIAEELVWEKNEKIKIQESIKPFKKENAIISRQLKSLNKQKMALERKLHRLEGDRGALEEKLTDMETMLVDKIAQISSLKEELEAIRREAQRSGRQPKKITPSEKESRDSVELPPIVVRPSGPEEITTQPTVTIPSQEAAIAEAPRFKGNILTVNRDGNFVIVDLGEDAGIQVGTVFQVDRGGEPVAIIEVIKTSKSVSACDIKEQRTPVKVGDAIR